MSFPNLIEDLTDGAVDHDFDLRFTEGSKSVRTDIAAPQAEPSILTISHQESGTSTKTYRNSKVRFDQTITNADGVQEVLSWYLVCRNPLKVATSAQALALGKQLVDFANTGTNLTKVLAGEI